MENQSQDVEKLLDKIRKLIAKSEDSSVTEEEAALYAAKAQELLAQHNISMAEFQKATGQKQEWVEDRNLVSRDLEWYRPIFLGCAKLYFCGYYYSQFGGKMINFFVGQEHNIVVAQLMSGYLIAAVRRLSNEGQKRVHETERKRYKASFRLAAARRLEARMLARVEQTRRGATVTSTGSTLPALRSLYDEIDDMLRAYEGDKKVRKVKSKAEPRHWQGAMDGYKAGNDISLETQVGQQKGASVSIGKQALLPGKRTT